MTTNADLIDQQVGPVQVGPPQVGPVQVGPAQVGPGQGCQAQDVQQDRGVQALTGMRGPPQT